MFAYVFDMLLSWSRRQEYKLGFGPFPIIFSTNLFLWFRDDWFYLQFLMIAVGFLGKEFIKWEREGRRVHIFNPSAFALGLFSLATHDPQFCALQSNSILVVVSRGLIEARSGREEFGLERLYAVIEAHGHTEAEYLLYQVEKALGDFREGAKQKDDITMVAVKVS